MSLDILLDVKKAAPQTFEKTLLNFFKIYHFNMLFKFFMRLPLHRLNVKSLRHSDRTLSESIWNLLCWWVNLVLKSKH